MKQNMNNTDRLVRLVLAGLMAVLYFTGTVTGTWGYVALAFGAIMILTAFIKFCPLYTIFGFSTCKTDIS
jgi:hypothetical protein